MFGRRAAAALRTALDPADRPDAELVHAFVADRDESAFAALVRRHGPMVWAVCRNLLPVEADAEDAFQATFLALVRSAGRVRDPAAVGGWLHGAAVRVATKLRRGAARRRLREVRAAAPEGARPAGGDWADLHAAVHAEVDRLPPRERAVFVLCSLEGVRQADAAARLGIKLNSVSGLLARARGRVLARLAARGLAPAAALGVVPQTLSAARFDAAVAFVPAGAVAPGPVLTLSTIATEGIMTRARLAAAGLLVAAATITGGGVLVSAQVPGSSGGGSGPGSPAVGSSGPPPGMAAGVSDSGGAGARAGWTYKLVEKPSARPAFEKLLADQDAGGWEYVGTESLTTADAAGSAPGGAGGGPPAGSGGPGLGGAVPDPRKADYALFRRQRAAAPTGGGTGRGMPGMPGGGMSGGSMAGAAAPAGANLKSYPLRHLTPQTFIATHREIYGEPNGMRLAVVTESNAVLVFAAAKEHDQVARLMELIDRPADGPKK